MNNSQFIIYTNVDEYFPVLRNRFKNLPGVYKITCLATGRFYIGSSLNVRHRLVTHIRDFINNENSKFLQRGWNKYSATGFSIEAIKYCGKDETISHEQFYLDTLLFAQEYINSGKKDKRFRRLGFNICPTAGSTRGFNHSKRTRDIVSKTHNGRKLSDDHLKKISINSSGENNGMYNVKHSEDSKNRMSINSSGEKNGMFGATHTLKARESISEGHKKKIISLDLNVGVFIDFNSIDEAIEYFDLKRRSTAISKRLKNGRAFQGRYLFFYN